MTNNEKYFWTKHSQYKMRHYGLSPQRIKRIIRHPARIEEAIVPNLIAAMQPAGGKKYSEIWTMYSLAKSNVKGPAFDKASAGKQMLKVKVITAWRYPGKSPVRNPIPKEILEEIKLLI